MAGGEDVAVNLAVAEAAIGGADFEIAAVAAELRNAIDQIRFGPSLQHRQWGLAAGEHSRAMP